MSETSVYKSLNITLNPRSYIIGTNFSDDNIYIKEVEESTFAIDQEKILEEKLNAINLEIEYKKAELAELESKKLMEVQQQKINILKDAEKEANQIVASAQEKIKFEKEAGHKKGYDEGYAKSISDFNNEVSDQLKLLNNIISSNKIEKNQKLTELKKDILAIVDNISTEIIAKEITKYSDDILINNLTDIIEYISDTKEIVIKVHNDNVEKIKNLKKNISEQLSSLEKLRVIGIENIGLTDCIIESDRGSFESNLKNKIKSLLQNLEQTLSEELK